MSKNKTDQPVTAAVDSCPFQNGKQTMKSKEAVDLELSVKKKRNVYDAPLRKPSLLQRLEQHFQIHIIRHPWGILANTIGFVLVIFQSVQVAGYKPMPQKRELFGQTFCYAGQVVISEWDKVEEILSTKPQKRTFQLGFFPLTPDHLPAMVTEKCWQRRKRNLFLLALSSKTGEKDEMHEACYKVFVEYLMKGALAKQNDPIAKGLMSQLVEDYKSMPHGEGGEFFTDTQRGLPRFMIKYLHFCMFGISPTDKEKIDVLFNFYYGNRVNTAAFYYPKVFGKLFNMIERPSFKSQLPAVAKIYKESPSLVAMPDPVTSFNLSSEEVAHMVIPIMSIAGTVGPRHILRYSMGYERMTQHVESADTHNIDVSKLWDNLDLDDIAEVQRYIYEICRLQTPVGQTHHVATEKFTVEMMGKNRTFPKGTIISIPIKLAMLDENIWANPHAFDHNRKDLVEKSMVFHSVGDKTNGRMCPGKFLTMNMVTEILVECGKARRLQ